MGVCLGEVWGVGQQKQQEVFSWGRAPRIGGRGKGGEETGGVRRR